MVGILKLSRSPVLYLLTKIKEARLVVGCEKSVGFRERGRAFRLSVVRHQESHSFVWRTPKQRHIELITSAHVMYVFEKIGMNLKCPRP